MNIIIKYFFYTIFYYLLVTTALTANETKIKIGLLVPLSGDNSQVGNEIVEAVRLALKDINNHQIEIYPKDTKSDPSQTLISAIELEKNGIDLVIGPVFYDSLAFLGDINN